MLLINDVLLLSQENTACKDDFRIPNYLSCQCKVGFVQMSVASDSPAMICEPAKTTGKFGIKSTNSSNVKVMSEIGLSGE